MERKAISGIMLTLMLIGMLTLAFNIRPVKASGTIYVRPDGSIDPPTAPIQRDGDLYIFTDNINDEIVVEIDNIVIDGASYTVHGTGAQNSIGIYLSARNNVTVKNTKVQQFWNGIFLSDSNSNTLSDNVILTNTVGIILQGSNNNTLIENDLSNNYYGITLAHSSSENRLSGNIASSNNMQGIGLCSDSNNNTLVGNTASRNTWGIQLDSSTSNNKLSENIVSLNSESGIRLFYSTNNTLVSNNVTSNNYAIWLCGSSRNKIFHNNLISNAEQVYDLSWDEPWNPPSINFWDDGYPSGGNHWSDYTGLDEKSGSNQDQVGSDGIGDTPYDIDVDNQDNCPLIYPWSSVERKVGVEVGDWVKYSNFDVSWSSNDPDATMPIGLSILREGEWWENTVEDILDTKIRYQQLLHFKNGSEYTTTVWIDVDTGSGTPLSFVSSGLVPDDCIYASAPWYAWKINETISHMCAGVNRETNHLNATTSMQIGPPPLYPNTTGNFYWDKETGVLCELSMRHLNQTESYVTSWLVFYRIVDTNLWKAPCPTEATQHLIETIRTWDLPKGTENSLTSKLEDALHLLDIGNENGAAHKLMDFINQVKALQGKKLTNEQADYLISEAQKTIDLIDG